MEAATQELEIIDLAQAEYTVTAMQYAGPATFLAVAARTVLVDPAAAEAYLTRLRRIGGWFDQIGERLRTSTARGGCRSPRWPSRPLSGPKVCWRPRHEPGAVPPAAAGVAPSGGVGGRTPGGRRGGGAPGAGEVGGHRQGAAPAGAPIAAGRAGLPARRRRRLRPGGPDLHHPAAICGRTAPDRPGSCRSTGGPGRGAGRRPWAARAGRGFRRPAGLVREDSRGGGHTPGGGRGEAGRGTGRRVLPRAPSAAVRGEADAGGRGRERCSASLHPAPSRRWAARDVLVQYRTSHRRYRMGHRRGGLPRSGARASSAALPPPAAHRPARPPAPAQPRRVLGGLGPVRRTARRGSRAVHR